jgi:hypothetical protein
MPSNPNSSAAQPAGRCYTDWAIKTLINTHRIMQKMHAQNPLSLFSVHNISLLIIHEKWANISYYTPCHQYTTLSIKTVTKRGKGSAATCRLAEVELTIVNNKGES